MGLLHDITFIILTIVITMLVIIFSFFWLIIHIELIHLGLLYSFYPSEITSAWTWFSIELLCFLLYKVITKMARLCRKVEEVKYTLERVIVDC